jgi:hypothetical protein
MNALLERINKTADEIIGHNLIKDMPEQKIIELISEDEIFVYTMTSACPTSFLTCC